MASDETFQQPREQMAGEEQRSQLLITERKQCMKQKAKNNRSKWENNREKNESKTLQTVSLRLKRATPGCPTRAALAQRSLGATDQYLDFKSTVKFPLGLGGAR